MHLPYFYPTLPIRLLVSNHYFCPLLSLLLSSNRCHPHRLFNPAGLYPPFPASLHNKRAHNMPIAATIAVISCVCSLVGATKNILELPQTIRKRNQSEHSDSRLSIFSHPASSA